jgi:hypothetical protein
MMTTKTTTYFVLLTVFNCNVEAREVPPISTEMQLMRQSSIDNQKDSIDLKDYHTLDAKWV